MLVCKHWRDIVVDTPELWTHWDFSAGSRWINLALVRSKMAPVNIAIPSAEQVIKKYPAFMAALRDPEFQERIREIFVDGQELSMKNLFATLGNSPLVAFNIQTLTIKTWSYDQTTMSLHPVDGLFSHEFPRLRWLCVSACDFEWNSRVFVTSHLTSLTLAKPPDTVQPTLSQFLSILKRHPTLETLRLGGAAVPVYDSYHKLRLPLIHLPQLEELSVEGQILDCASLFRHICCPVATRINFDTNAENQEHISVLSFAISEHYQGIKRTRDLARARDSESYPHLSFTVAEFEWNVRVVSECTDSFGTYLPTTMFMLKITWPWQIRPVQCDVPAVSLLRPLPLEDVKSFAVCDAPFLSCEEWRHHVFRLLGGVETLEVKNSSMSTLLLALRPNNNEDEGGDCRKADVMRGRPRKTNTRVALPRLLALQIERCDVTNELIECLELRKERGFRLKTLMIRSCCQQPGFDFERLSGAVGGDPWAWDCRSLIS